MSGLNTRKESILNVVVKDYISTAEPVGSGTVCRKYFHDLSSATVRSEMSTLVHEGYLKKPHTSAGRVPTDKGYRFYVDSLGSYYLTPQDIQYVEKSFHGEHFEMEDLLQLSLGIIAKLTNKTGIILSPPFHKTVLKRIELIGMGKNRILVVVVGNAGDTFNRYVQMEEDLPQEYLNSISRFLNDTCSGLSLPAIREKVAHEMAADRRRYDLLIKRAMNICSRFFANQEPEADLRFVGIENLCNQQEFMSDVASMKEAFKALEKKASLIMILDRCLVEDKPGIFIGTETGSGDTKDCAVIAHNYKCGDQSLGTLAIFGHKRMEYPRVISIVNYTANRLSKILSEQRL